MDEELKPILSQYEAEVNDLMTDLERKLITPKQWHKRMKQLLARYHMTAMMVGMGTTRLTAESIQLLTKTLEEGQFPYLNNFFTVVAASSRFNPAWRVRAKLYALSPKTSFWEGHVYKQIGRFLPLPAMPAQGTQCHTNCGCSWDIKTIDGEAGDYDAYWRRSKDDSCQTCIEREAQWNPVQIRGGVLEL